MAYNPITSNEILNGAPIDQNLLTKIKDNFTDLKVTADTVPGLASTVAGHTADITDLRTANPWIALSFSGTWINYNGGTGYAPAAYYKDDNGRVHLRGLVQNNAAGSAATIIGTLPVGFRPAFRAIFTANWSGGSGVGRVDVDNSGQIISQNGSVAVSFFSLEGISFKAEL